MPIWGEAFTVTNRTFLIGIEGRAVCAYKDFAPFVMQWTHKVSGDMLSLSQDDELTEALMLQCDSINQALICQGIPSSNLPTLEASGQVPVVGTEQPEREYLLSDLLKFYRGAQHEQYLKATLTLDLQTLQRLELDGVPTDWIVEAVDEISNAKLPLDVKRAAIGRIFRDSARLNHVIPGLKLNNFVEWLPRDDWAPLLRVAGARADYSSQLESAQHAAKIKGLFGLACDIDHARGLICGEWLDSGR